MFDFTRRNRKPKPAKKVKLDIINAIELKPEASYVLVVDAKSLKRTEVEAMLADLRKAGIKNVVSFMLSGSPDDAIQLVTKGNKNAKARV